MVLPYISYSFTPHGYVEKWMNIYTPATIFLELPMKFLLPLLFLFSSHSYADTKSNSRAIDHAPIGVMGDHYHKKGEAMFSVRHSYMKMSGNRYNGDNVSTQDILAMPNPLGNMPANLSVVPVEMTMKMTMVGGMYAPTNKITLMAMGMFMSKDMDLNTYQPMMNRDLLGTFSTSSSDISDISLGALIKLQESDTSRWHGQLAVQKSVGSNDIKGVVLTPMNMQMSMTLPYGMQPSDRATKLVVGITNVTKLTERWLWGNQLRKKFTISDDDWAFGNHTELNSWAQYELNQAIALSSRLQITHQGKISGKNPMIMAPVQTANPENYGGSEVIFGLGVNIVMKILPGEADRFGLEVTKPLAQDKNGLQMSSDYKISFGYQKSF